MLGTYSRSELGKLTVINKTKRVPSMGGKQTIKQVRLIYNSVKMPLNF